MIFQTPIPKGTSPRYHEASTMRPTRDSDGVGKAWLKSKKEQSAMDGMARSLSQTAREVQKLKRRIVGGGGGNFILWQQPYKEIDPTLAVAKGTWVYISPNNTIVTTGLVDVATLVTQTACEGMWEAAQDVPPINGSSQYNVPTFPYPSATGTPTGSAGSIQGDLDSVDIFWIYHGQLSCA